MGDTTTRTERLVGRADELATLAARLDRGLAGHGGLILIDGPAGIGKTALARFAAAHAAARGAAILEGGGYDLAETPPYGPWLELLAGLHHYPDLLPTPPYLLRPDAADRPADQAALFAQVRDYLGTLARRRPLLLIIEDLHWADPASLALLRALARWLSAGPILLLATYRDDEIGRGHPLYDLLPLLVREADPLRCTPRQLDPAATRAFVRARHVLRVPDEERLVAYLGPQAGGNPFYLGELLRSLAETGELVPGTDGWRVGDLAGAALPSSLRQVIDGRAARLSAAARAMLDLAAVIGQEVPLALWAAAGAAEEEILHTTIERATEARLLEEAADGLRARFPHALIREALYQELEPARRRGWHRRVAEALLATAAPDPDALAYHLVRCDDPRAVDWLIQAGERAARAYAWLSAAERFEAAHDLLETRDAEPARRARLLFLLSRLRRFADPAWGLAALGRVAALAVAVGDRSLEAQARYSGGLLRCYLGDLRPGLAEMGAGVARLDAIVAAGGAVRDAEMPERPVDPTDWHDTYAAWLAEAGRRADVVATLALDPATLAPPAPPRNPEGYQALGLLRAIAGDPAGAGAAFAAARAAYEDAGHHFLVCISACYALEWVALPYAADDRAASHALSRAAEAAARRAAGAERADAPARGSSLPLLLVEGDWAELAAVAPITASLGPGFAIYAATCLAPLARAQGDPQAAWRLLDDVLPDGPATPPGGLNFFRAHLLQRLAAALALDAGDLPRARAWLAAHDRWCAWNDGAIGRAAGLLGWAEWHRAAGDAARARTLAGEAAAAASAPRQPLTLLAAERLLGELALAAGRHGPAGAHLDRALALADACHAPYERALTLLALAELRLASGDAARAREALDEAHTRLAQLGARPALARATALAERPGVPPVPHLTPREREVLRLIAAGLGNRAIAARLGRSIHTVERHITHLYAKVGARGRADAVAFALRHGL